MNSTNTLNDNEEGWKPFLNIVTSLFMVFPSYMAFKKKWYGGMSTFFCTACVSCIYHYLTIEEEVSDYYDMFQYLDFVFAHIKHV